MSDGRRFLIIGAGASGALMAAHLLRQHSGHRVTIVEQRNRFGRGLAYGTDNPIHLLNVRAANMSAFADDPDHFWRWLVEQGLVGADDDRFCFVPRGVYGRYLESLILSHLWDDDRSDALTLLKDQANEIRRTANGIEVLLLSGARISGDAVILACGHESIVDDGPLHLSPWSEPVGGGAARDSTLLILGTGLTMVDAAAALVAHGHRGPIVALSRRGLLPQTHRDVKPLKIETATAPFGRDLASLCQWVRKLARETEAHGGDWRSVIDGLRPHTQPIWRAMSPVARRRFLRHARPWWDTHRHRMAPEVAGSLQRLIDNKRLEIIAGRIVDIASSDEGARVNLRRRGERANETIEVSRIISCKGVTSDPNKSANPIVASLFNQGHARRDLLGIGIDVDPNCAVLDRNGTPGNIFAIGPMSQAAFWEITAVPDIRLQVEGLAKRLHDLN